MAGDGAAAVVSPEDLKSQVAGGYSGGGTGGGTTLAPPAAAAPAAAALLPPHRFKGRTVAVVNDLTLDEQWYVYCKARELKDAIKRGEDLSRFRLQDLQAAVYTIFLEDSTRTKESFRNAAVFHGLKVNVFDAKTSSFQKNETITDTVKMLCGYSIGQSTFVIRSKVEGVCRWLEEAIGEFTRQRGFPRASFVNAGDGRHEHPTQELLDEFSFLEHKGWDTSSIHLALLGDLFHGRTVHSKVDGLKLYDEVEVDLIAPKELALPQMYIDKMKFAGFKVREFASIEEYLHQPHVSKIWYFTRLQLERMGDKVLDRAAELRKAVTFQREFLPNIPEGSRFFHPLPRDSRHPDLPFWLDSTEYNGWDQQSQNGYFTRIILLGLLGGLMGEDFADVARRRGGGGGSPGRLSDAELSSPLPPPMGDSGPNGGRSPFSSKRPGDFVEELPPSSEEGEEAHFRQAGLSPLTNGVVIDRLAEGQPAQDVWGSMFMVRSVLGLNSIGGMGVYKHKVGAGSTERVAGFITAPDLDVETQWDRLPLKRLAAMSPGATLTVLKEGQPLRKFRLRVPPRIYNFPDISCKNAACISHPSNAEGEVSAYFLRARGSAEEEAEATGGDGGASTPRRATKWAFSCKFCDNLHSFREIWDLKHLGSQFQAS